MCLQFLLGCHPDLEDTFPFEDDAESDLPGSNLIAARSNIVGPGHDGLDMMLNREIDVSRGVIARRQRDREDEKKYDHFSALSASLR
jgi:hypothetical protein